MNLLMKRCERHSHLVEDLIKDWRADHEQAMAVRDIEELVEECCGLGKLLVRTWGGMLKLLFTDEKFNMIEVLGRRFHGVVAKALLMFRTVEKSIADADQKEYTVEGAEEFRQTVSQLLRVEQDFAKEWP